MLLNAQEVQADGDVALGIWMARLPSLLAAPAAEDVPLASLSAVLVAAYADRAAQLARGSLPLHDTAFDAVMHHCRAQWPGIPETGIHN